MAEQYFNASSANALYGYYPEELLDALMTESECDQDVAQEDVMHALEDIRAMAQNPQTGESWRALWYTLARMTEKVDSRRHMAKLT